MNKVIALVDANNFYVSCERLFSPSYIGVALLNIVQDNYLQQDILEEYSHTYEKRSKALMQAVDLLNKKYGRGTIQHAVEGIEKEWKVKAELLSPRYTTRWDELKGVG